MKVGYFQTHPEFGEVQRNLEQVASRLRSADCELLVLPEFAFTGYQFVDQEEVRELSERVPDGPTTQACLELAHRHRMHLVVGLPEQAGGTLLQLGDRGGPFGVPGKLPQDASVLRGNVVLQPRRLGVSGVGHRPSPHWRS